MFIDFLRKEQQNKKKPNCVKKEICKKKSFDNNTMASIAVITVYSFIGALLWIAALAIWRFSVLIETEKNFFPLLRLSRIDLNNTIIQ